MDKILELEKRIELLEKAVDELLNRPVLNQLYGKSKAGKTHLRLVGE